MVSSDRSGDTPAPVDGEQELATLEAPTAFLSPGQILGNRYRIRSELGRGGMGEVFRAFDLKLRVDVAVKSLRDELLSRERALETLRQEVRVAREVISPNVCRVFDLLEIEGRELVSMEYIDGTTLIEVLGARGPLDLEETREIALQFLAGLEAIHQAGLVHRDIKPENVMITRSGRVVVMDFGIAKGLAAEGTGTVAGTPAYMAPEQELGEAVDARADVYSAGVLLAEMMAPEGVRDREARQAVWRGVREDPPRLSDSPWQAVLERAVARSPDERYASAAKLSRALEEVALRVEGAEDVTPYPGLAAFTEEDAGYFFGRELEVEEMWKKLRRPHLLAVAGQSGAGKSSFLRAGLLASCPEGWGHVICTPGSAPFASLRESLVTEVSGDAEAMRELVRGEDLEAMVSAASRWRQRHKQALVILDQFEELFTLNSAEEQLRFSELLGRLALDADVHVLLSMRDDFLFHCSDQPALKPIFSELTLLRSPTGSSLRRALVQPALNCGYRFEDEGLVDEMVDELREERGALPLVAFAAAALWERRDREAGLLTREAYEEIGGVAGALAQHADATLEGIGSERVPLVRELFRNLVTARGTRAARDRDELLSVFEQSEREGAAEVLDALVDSRLLTSYELPAEEEEGPQGRHRIEIIHESLLSAWPRLVRWQTQDADGVQLRDQLRHAVRTWEERDRSDDLLWTGTAFREFQLWRERYPGGLSEAEERFETAMTTLATGRQRRRRIALAAMLSVLLGVVGVMGVLWLQAEASNRQSEAARLLALGRLELDRSPTAALAYALASLELLDDPDTRVFALEALWRGPTAFVSSGARSSLWQVDFSPDGRLLAGRHEDGSVDIWSRNGGAPRSIAVDGKGAGEAYFGSGSDQLITSVVAGEALRFWSLADGHLERTLELPGLVSWSLSSDRSEVFTVSPRDGAWQVQSWPVRGGEATLLERFEGDLGALMRIDPTGDWLIYLEGDQRSLSFRSLADGPAARVGRLGRHEAVVTALAISPDGKLVASGDRDGRVLLWPLPPRSEPLLLTLGGSGGRVRGLNFDASGQLLAAATGDKARLWRLDGPSEADPLLLDLNQRQMNFAALHPTEPWLATAGANGRLLLWPLADSYPHVLRGHSGGSYGVEFSPEGSWVVSSGNGGVLRSWPLGAELGAVSRVLHQSPYNLYDIDLGPGGESLLVGVNLPRVQAVAGEKVGIYLVSRSGGEPRVLEGFTASVWYVALSPDGRFAAGAGGQWIPEEGVIRVWNLEDGGVEVLDQGEQEWITHLQFTATGRLLSAGCCAVRSWNLEDGSFETVREPAEGAEGARFAMALSRGGELLASAGTEFSPTAAPEARLPPLQVKNLETGNSWEISSHGEAYLLTQLAVGRAGKTLVSGSWHGQVRAGPITGEEPHLLLGHVGFVMDIAVSPDGRLIASAGQDSALRLWRMPEGRPLHTLPYQDLLARLQSLTNLRAVADDNVEGGYKVESGPFAGWKTAPAWQK